MESSAARCCSMHIYNSKVQIHFGGYFSVIVFVKIKCQLKETGTVRAKKIRAMQRSVRGPCPNIYHVLRSSKLRAAQAKNSAL